MQVIDRLRDEIGSGRLSESARVLLAEERCPSCGDLLVPVRPAPYRRCPTCGAEKPVIPTDPGAGTVLGAVSLGVVVGLGVAALAALLDKPRTRRRKSR